MGAGELGRRQGGNGDLEGRALFALSHFQGPCDEAFGHSRGVASAIHSISSILQSRSSTLARFRSSPMDEPEITQSSMMTGPFELLKDMPMAVPTVRCSLE